MASSVISDITLSFYAGSEGTPLLSWGPLSACYATSVKYVLYGQKCTPVPAFVCTEHLNVDRQSHWSLKGCSASCKPAWHLESASSWWCCQLWLANKSQKKAILWLIGFLSAIYIFIRVFCLDHLHTLSVLWLNQWRYFCLTNSSASEKHWKHWNNTESSAFSILWIIFTTMTAKNARCLWWVL